MIKLWHGSLDASIASFRPGVHLGSEIQALMTTIAAEVLDGRPGSPTLYFCSLRAQPDEIFKLADWYTPYMQGTLHAYMKEHGESLRFTREYLREFNNLNHHECEAVGLKLLSREMAKRGHVALRYRNAVEYKPDDSYSVIDAERLKIDAMSFPDEAEVRLKLRNVAKDDTGYDETQWVSILRRLERAI